MSIERIEYAAITDIPQFSFIENRYQDDNSTYYCKFIMPEQDIEVKLIDTGWIE